MIIRRSDTLASMLIARVLVGCCSAAVAIASTVPTASWAASDKSAVVESVSIISGKVINLNPEAKGDHRDLRVRVNVQGLVDPSPSVTVRLTQYEARGGDKTTTPRISLKPIGLRLARVTGSRATYTGTVPFADLQVAGARISYGGRALLCIDSATAVSGDVELPESDRAIAEQGGSQCVRVVHRRGMTTEANALYAGELRNASITKARGSTRYLTFTAQSLSFFRDRPARTASSLPFSELAHKPTWRRTFEQPAPVVEIAIDGTTRHVPVRMGAPRALGDGRYRAKITFPTSSRLSARAVKGQDLAFFASATPVTNPDPATCVQQSEAIADGFVPPGSDFVSSLGETTITAVPGADHLLLKSSDPLYFNWYRGAGYGCDSQRTGAAEFAALGDIAQWSSMFGRINPNSALLWEDGQTSEILEFEQEKPKFDEASGLWVSVIRPFSGDEVPSEESVDRFIRTHGTSLTIASPYLFMDATGSTYYGGGTWYVDENFLIRYLVNPDEQTIDFTFTLSNGSDGWMGLCFNEFMFPADCIIAWMDDGVPSAWDAYNPGIPTLPVFPSPIQDTDPVLQIEPPNPLDNVDNLLSITDVSGSDPGSVSIEVSRKLVTEDIFDYQIYEGWTNVVAAYNATQGFINEFNALQPGHTATGSSRLAFVQTS